jgi:heat shock protein HslJ
MKNIKLFYILALVIAFCTLQSSSCSKHDSLPTTTQTNTEGNWRLSLYFDNSDETYKFSGYTFSFNSNGQVAATNGTNTVTGTWSQTSNKFNIDFGSAAVFNDLNDDWLIETKTSTSIQLKDDNPARNEKLQFVKL